MRIAGAERDDQPTVFRAAELQPLGRSTAGGRAEPRPPARATTTSARARIRVTGGRSPLERRELSRAALEPGCKRGAEPDTAAAHALQSLLQPGDAVLLKDSRTARLSRLADASRAATVHVRVEEAGE
jgi:hypothetical protein